MRLCGADTHEASRPCVSSQVFLGLVMRLESGKPDMSFSATAVDLINRIVVLSVGKCPNFCTTCWKCALSGVDWTLDIGGMFCCSRAQRQLGRWVCSHPRTHDCVQVAR